MEKKLHKAMETVLEMVRLNMKADEALKFSQSALNLAHAKNVLLEHKFNEEMCGLEPADEFRSAESADMAHTSCLESRCSPGNIEVKEEDDGNTIVLLFGALRAGVVKFDSRKDPSWCVAIDGVSDGWSRASRFHTKGLAVAYALAKLGVEQV